MQLDKKLETEIREFCKMNGLKPTEYVNSLLKQAFLNDKFGLSPISAEMSIQTDPVSGLNVIGPIEKEERSVMKEEKKEENPEIEFMDLIDESPKEKESNKSVKSDTKPKKRVLK